MNRFALKFLAIGLVFLIGCAPKSPASTVPTQDITTQTVAAPTNTSQITPLADVQSISIGGDPGNYQFSVEIKSPDTGCEQYADWWEVTDEDGSLLYRRILLHSHPDEQPFTRSGGPVPIQASSVVIIRAHMHPSGYGGTALIGSVQNGFKPVTLEPDFASNLETTPPLPGECAF